ncbi:hypothetical protein ETD86_37415 [Nonomuraea turkmeniaca]|uniref:Uncharacterized protein n=1 Tax=Nonomuraea turkmeniaca TaxID=103838 RepID=A0A5S4F4D4_9ACTN|nr:hypothetical protein [Nonomuraea turkmeniaca]TMR10998.1 hypothetical protein ETD86_37415 [Nonomuraea turkmeniaca]
MPRRNVTPIRLYNTIARARHAEVDKAVLTSGAEGWYPLALAVIEARQAYIQMYVANGTLDGDTEPTTEQVPEISVLGKTLQEWLDAQEDRVIYSIASAENFPGHLMAYVSAKSLRWWLNVAFGQMPSQKHVEEEAERRRAEAAQGVTATGARQTATA